jgi:3-phosphoshikimate 1-carboxyvinyltransferase
MTGGSDHGGAGAGPDWQAPVAAGPVRATIALPGSKSMTNRALVLAALADSPTTITGPLVARDTNLMAGALRALGAGIGPAQDGPAQDSPVQAGPAPDSAAQAGPAPDSAAQAGPVPDGASWRVVPGLRAAGGPVDVGNAGTVLRFVPAVAALAAGDTAFTGDARASQRPVGPLLAGLRELGAVIDDGGRGALPFTVRGQGAMAGGTAVLDASASSQLVSGLLLAAPRFGKGAELRHEGARVPSAPHLAMTVQMLRDAGADVETGSRGASPGGAGAEAGASGGASVIDIWRVHPGVLSPGTITVEPDLVNSAPFLAAALLTGGSVTIAGWPARTTQPAAQILAVLTAMGATAAPAAGGMRFTGSGPVRGVTADLGDVSELSPVLTALAALADGPSVFTGIGHQRAQECDRLAAMATEINALGGDVRERPDGLEIRPRPLRATGRPWHSYDDHRLVMAAAVTGLAVPGLTVQNAGTVGKTFPAFTGLWAGMLGAAH